MVLMDNILQKNKIIFVSKVVSLNDDSSSTDIMTYNLVSGLHKLNKSIILIAICEPDQESGVIKTYSDITDNVVFYNTKWGKNQNKYKHLFNLLYGLYNYREYKHFVSNKDIPENAILISHSPSLESIYIARMIKKIRKNMLYIQYWSDPCTLSLISIKEYNYKRILHRYVENKSLSYADEIVYGTKTLYESQKNFFEKRKNKMRYIDISYMPSEEIDELLKIECSRILYAGNFSSQIRNIIPLLEAVEELKGKIGLDIYGSGDIDLSKYKNTTYRGNVSPKEMKRIENSYNSIISLTNLKGCQIPGKTFYNMNRPQNILVLLEGTETDSIQSYLKKYKRFIICKNNKKDIITALLQSLNETPKIDYVIENYSPSKIAQTLIGTKEDNFF